MHICFLSETYAWKFNNKNQWSLCYPFKHKFSKRPLVFLSALLRVSEGVEKSLIFYLSQIWYPQHRYSTIPILSILAIYQPTSSQQYLEWQETFTVLIQLQYKKCAERFVYCHWCDATYTLVPVSYTWTVVNFSGCHFQKMSAKLRFKKSCRNTVRLWRCAAVTGFSAYSYSLVLMEEYLEVKHQAGNQDMPLSDIHCASFDVWVRDLGHHKVGSTRVKWTTFYVFWNYFVTLFIFKVLIFHLCITSLSCNSV